MSRSSAEAPKSRGSFAMVAAFLFGLPVGVGLLWFLHHGPYQDSDFVEYVKHPVEMTEVVMFCCAVGAMLAKIIAALGEWSVRRRELLPAWSGDPVPVSEAGSLRSHLAALGRGVQRSFLGRRIANVLDFVESRGSVGELDDQLRTLADNDVMTQEGSYALLRFITWAIPILGFLGTVLGITNAIKGVTPEVLEKSLSGVTDGLATAFDSTALALFLTMILMLCSSLLERLEQGILEKVDAYVDAELSHRFERTGPESSQFVDALRQNTQVLLKSTEQLVDRQATLWSRSLEKADRAWNETGHVHQQQLTTSLTQALESTLTRHTQRLTELEEKLLGRGQALVQGMAQVAQALSKQSEALMQPPRRRGATGSPSGNAAAKSRGAGRRGHIRRSRAKPDRGDSPFDHARGSDDAGDPLDAEARCVKEPHEASPAQTASLDVPVPRRAAGSDGGAHTSVARHGSPQQNRGPQQSP